MWLCWQLRQIDSTSIDSSIVQSAPTAQSTKPKISIHSSSAAQYGSVFSTAHHTSAAQYWVVGSQIPWIAFSEGVVLFSSVAFFPVPRASGKPSPKRKPRCLLPDFCWVCCNSWIMRFGMLTMTRNWYRSKERNSPHLCFCTFLVDFLTFCSQGSRNVLQRRFAEESWWCGSCKQFQRDKQIIRIATKEGCLIQMDGIGYESTNLILSILITNPRDYAGISRRRYFQHQKWEPVATYCCKSSEWRTCYRENIPNEISRWYFQSSVQHISLCFQKAPDGWSEKQKGVRREALGTIKRPLGHCNDFARQIFKPQETCF